MSDTDRNARLKQFFASYFNQDWDIGGAKSWMDVVIQFVTENPSGQVLAVRDDLRSWLSETEHPSGGVAPHLPSEFGCDYDPRADGVDDRAWVEQIVDLLTSRLGI